MIQAAKVKRLHTEELCGLQTRERELSGLLEESKEKEVTVVDVFLLHICMFINVSDLSRTN
jgi:hypothetical protein